MRPMPKEMKGARVRALMSARVHELIDAHTPKGIKPCPDKPVYILPTGMTGTELKRIKKHDPMNVVFPQVKTK